MADAVAKGRAWKNLIGPGTTTDLNEHLQKVMTAIALARGRGILTNPPREEGAPEERPPVRRPQHYKPDLLLVRSDNKNRLHFTIVDVTAGSDDKIIIEDEYTRRILRKEETHDKLMDHMSSGRFSDEGRLTDLGLHETPPPARADAKRVHYFKQAHYAKRYTSLARVLKKAGSQGCTVEIRVLAVGVCGWIPKFTRMNMKALLEAGGSDSTQARKQHNSLIRSTIIEALNHLVRAHRAWVNE